MRVTRKIVASIANLHFEDYESKAILIQITSKPGTLKERRASRKSGPGPGPSPDRTGTETGSDAYFLGARQDVILLVAWPATSLQKTIRSKFRFIDFRDRGQLQLTSPMGLLSGRNVYYNTLMLTTFEYRILNPQSSSKHALKTRWWCCWGQTFYTFQPGSGSPQRQTLAAAAFRSHKLVSCANPKNKCFFPLSLFRGYNRGGLNGFPERQRQRNRAHPFCWGVRNIQPAPIF